MYTTLIPNELLVTIFEHLILISIGENPLRAVRQVCSRWRTVALRSNLLLDAPLPIAFSLPVHAVAHLTLQSSPALAPHINGTQLSLFGNPIADFNHWHRPHWIIYRGEIVLPLQSHSVPLVSSGQHTLCAYFNNTSCRRCQNSRTLKRRYTLPPSTPTQIRNHKIEEYFKPIPKGTTSQNNEQTDLQKSITSRIHTQAQVSNFLSLFGFSLLRVVCVCVCVRDFDYLYVPLSFFHFHLVSCLCLCVF
jgi:hypothetical protein